MTGWKASVPLTTIGRPQDPLGRAARKLKEAERLRKSDDLPKAKRICEELLGQFPDYVAALHALGLVLADMGHYERAISPLSKASSMCPDDWNLLASLGHTYVRSDSPEAAQPILERADRLSGGSDENIAAMLAEIYWKQRDYQLAAEAYERLVVIDTASVDSKLQLGRCYERLGRLADAAKIYRALLDENDPNFAATTRLARLPESVTSFDEFHLLDQLTPATPNQTDILHYARAAGFHRTGRYGDAWDELLSANNNKKREMATAWQDGAGGRDDILNFAREAPVLAERTSKPDGVPLSLFILGPSRSGKTTLESLIGKLPGVALGYDNRIVEDAVRKTMQNSGLITRTNINLMPRDLDPLFVKFYEAQIVARADDAAIFTNTSRSKIIGVLRYATTIPGSRFVYIKRDINDLMFRIFATNYGSGNAYAFSIKTINEHIAWYDSLADILVEKFPNVSRVVSYDQLASDPNSMLTTVCELCGLDPKVNRVHIAPATDTGISRPYQAYIRQALTK